MSPQGAELSRRRRQVFKVVNDTIKQGRIGFGTSLPFPGQRQESEGLAGGMAGVLPVCVNKIQVRWQRPAGLCVVGPLHDAAKACAQGPAQTRCCRPRRGCA